MNLHHANKREGYEVWADNKLEDIFNNLVDAQALASKLAQDFMIRNVRIVKVL